MGKRVLITGGAGFIGAHLVEHLLKNTDWHLVVLDGLKYAGRVDRLTSIEGYDPGRVTLVWHDLRAPLGEQLRADIGDVQIVFHLASDSHVDNSMQIPAEVIDNNVRVTLNMLEWWRLHARGVEKFFQISTDEVYGPVPLDRPSREWDPILPSNPYSASKAAQEAICISYWRTFGLPLVITNTMNNFGERQHPEKFVPKVIKHIHQGHQIGIHAKTDAEGLWVPSSRVWLHARNHADALLFLARELILVKFPTGLWPARFNVAGQVEIDVATLARKIGAIMGKEPQLVFVDYHSSRPGHDMRYSLDGGRLETMGWKPPVPLQESLERTVRWTLEHKERWL